MISVGPGPRILIVIKVTVVRHGEVVIENSALTIPGHLLRNLFGYFQEVYYTQQIVTAIIGQY